MKIRGALTGAAVAAMAITVLALAAGVNFSGTWVLDRDKSDQPQMRGGGPGGGFGGGGQRGGGGQGGPMEVTLVIKQSDNDLAISRTVSRGGEARPPIEQKFTLDGKPNTNPVGMGRGEFKSKTKWSKDKLVTEGSQKVETPRGEFEIDVREEYSLSSDGKVLTIVTTRSTPMGDQTSKQVYNKK